MVKKLPVSLAPMLASGAAPGAAVSRAGLTAINPRGRREALDADRGGDTRDRRRRNSCRRNET